MKKKAGSQICLTKSERGCGMKIPSYALLVYLPSTLLGLFALTLFAVGGIPWYYLFGTLLSWSLMDGLGVAVGYHRVFAHRTHALPVWKDIVLLFLGSMAGHGSPLAWVAIHRGYHHAHADTPRDLHSPVHGWFSALMGWTFRLTDGSIRIKYAADLLRKPHVVFFHFHGTKIQWIITSLALLADWRLGMAFVCLPTAMSIWNESLINVFGHTWTPGAYRNFNSPDTSHNHPFFGYFGWGHGWHNNHHARPNGFDFGKQTSGKWWEFDPCRIFLPFLR